MPDDIDSMPIENMSPAEAEVAILFRLDDERFQQALHDTSDPLHKPSLSEWQALNAQAVPKPTLKPKVVPPDLDGVPIGSMSPQQAELAIQSKIDDDDFNRALYTKWHPKHQEVEAQWKALHAQTVKEKTREPCGLLAPDDQPPFDIADHVPPPRPAA